MTNARSPFPTPQVPEDDELIDTADDVAGEDVETPKKKTPPMPSKASPFNKPDGDDFEINLDGIDLNAKPFIEPGDHLMYCTDIIGTKSKANNPMIVWTFQVYDGPNRGKSAKLYTALTEAAIFSFVQTCAAMGFDLAENPKPKVKDLKDACLRAMVVGIFTPDTYNGQPSSQFQRVTAVEGQEPGTKIPTVGAPKVK